MNIKSSNARRLSLAGLVLTSGYAFAGGFQLTEQSVTGLGRAFSGFGVVGDDASAIFYNPAGMTLLKGNQTQASIFHINTSARFRNEGSTQSILGNVVPSRGPGKDGGVDGAVPAAFFSHELNDSTTIGLGVTVPYGLKTDYDKDWVGRYQAKETELITVDINPSIAYRLNDRLSVGAGVSAQYADATLSQAVFAGPQRPDGFAKVTANDWGYGFNFGAMYEFNANTRIGISYRSKIEQNLDGRLKLNRLGSNSGRTDAKAKIDLPETVHVGAYTRLFEHWELTGGVRWTRWDRFDEVRIRFGDGRPDSVTEHDWDNSWMVNAGLGYELNHAWAFRVGYAFDQTPIPNDRHRTARIPGNDRHWTSFGGSYKPTKNLSLAFGYTHVFIRDADIEHTIDLVSTSPGAFTDTLTGKYPNSSVDIIGLELNYRF